VKEYYETELGKLYQGDCLEVMDRLISEGVQVDLTVTSPPYDNLRTYKGSLIWNETIWKQVIENLYEITKDGGTVVWIVNDATIKGNETLTSFKQALYLQEVGFNVGDTMIWKKTNPFNFGSNYYYPQSFEYMFVCTKGKIKTSNLIRDRVNKNAGKTFKQIRRGADDKMEYDDKTVTLQKKGKRYNVWEFPVQSNPDHPATFPEKLVNDHIISWSNEGDTVFDPFMGSGTTGKMALLNNREFIGIEKVDEYFEIAKNRIEKAMEGDMN